jgi:hypothetical protein
MIKIWANFLYVFKAAPRGPHRGRNARPRSAFGDARSDDGPHPHPLRISGTGVFDLD